MKAANMEDVMTFAIILCMHHWYSVPVESQGELMYSVCLLQKNVLQGEQKDHVWSREGFYAIVLFFTIFVIITTCLMVTHTHTCSSSFDLCFTAVMTRYS